MVWISLLNSEDHEHLCKQVISVACQILREIKFGHFEALEIAILTFWAALNFVFLETFDIFKCEIFPKIKIQSLQNFSNSGFWSSEISQSWFHVKSEWQEND